MPTYSHGMPPLSPPPSPPDVSAPVSPGSLPVATWSVNTFIVSTTEA